MYDYKRRSRPKNFLSSFRLAAGGLGGAAQKNEKKIGLLPRFQNAKLHLAVKY